jgi:hypothetical protein
MSDPSDAVSSSDLIQQTLLKAQYENFCGIKSASLHFEVIKKIWRGLW